MNVEKAAQDAGNDDDVVEVTKEVEKKYVVEVTEAEKKYDDDDEEESAAARRRRLEVEKRITSVVDDGDVSVGESTSENRGTNGSRDYSSSIGRL